ncbi:hypothetical protein FA95DRAFT_1523825 [Auriscalpium vulgare]|uniref:Uncharacterized protein n=1 Tax=Auriscalpium vulgare TaxID=40419 RepID=A0ACB8RHS5_9AGAM|nr:hypothetical protein FA95DRAFT_1523825 [Auriscalpium vulgare]
MAEAPLEQLRAPGILEQWSTTRHDIGFYWSVGMTGRYHLPASSPFDSAILFGAVHTLISSHAPLGVSLVGENTAAAHFVQLKRIDLREVVEFVRAKDLSERDDVLGEIISKRHSGPFNDLGKLPLWRLYVVLPPDEDIADAGIDIALFLHHGVADGASALIFHRDLLAALNDPSASSSSHIINVPRLPLPAPLESRLSLSLSWWTIARALYQDIFPPSTKGLWTGGAVTNTPALQTHHIPLVLPPSTLSALLSACRMNGTTVTAVTEAAIAKALFGVLPADGNAEQLTCSVPISLRRFISDSDSVMGDFYTGEEHHFARADADDPWAVARRIKKELVDKIAAGSKNLNIGLLRYVSDLRKYFTGKVGKARTTSFEVSNAGVMDGKIDAQSGWRVTRLAMSQSAAVVGSAIEFSVCSVKGGELSISVNWQEGVVERGFVEQVVALLRTEIDSLSSSSSN